MGRSEHTPEAGPTPASPKSVVHPGHCPASDPPIPPTLKYRFSAANKITGGSIIITATAITRPQFVEFCWKKLCSPTGKVKLALDRRKTRATR